MIANITRIAGKMILMSLVGIAVSKVHGMYEDFVRSKGTRATKEFLMRDLDSEIDKARSQKEALQIIFERTKRLLELHPDTNSPTGEKLRFGLDKALDIGDENHVYWDMSYARSQYRQTINELL